jgi:Resolvase, N terminal domain
LVGDTLIVTRLDRLARSTRDLPNTLDAVAKKGATFRSLTDAWADTTTAWGVVADGARWPRRVRLRVDQGPYRGRRRAVEAGIKLGRRSSLTTYQQAEVLRRRSAGETLKTWRSLTG